MFPDVVGRLRRVARLGAGSFATVWLYHDDELDSDVAIKVLADNWVDQLDVAERFLQEARVLRAADSEHVVQVYDIGEIDGTPYFVMSYANLGTVADLAQDGPLDLATTVDLIGQAAIGLADLHSSGVVHRDVKPQNLLLRTDRRLGRRVHVTDLGMAKELAFASGMTQLVGSPGYMAPEQARVGARIDERADVHGLGAVAYRLMSGRQVREVSITGVAHAGPPEPLSEVADVPQPVSDVVMRALAVDPDERWPDPLSFADAYRAAAATVSAGTPSGTALLPPAEVPTARMPASDTAENGRRPARRWLFGAVIAVLAAVAVGVIMMLDPFDDDKGPAGAEDPDSTGQPDTTTPADPDSTSAPGDYCTALLGNEVGLAKLSSDDPEEVREGMDAVHAMRQVAPAAVADNWATIDDPLLEFQSVLEDAGTSWAEFTADPEGAEPEVTTAAAKMFEGLEAADDALSRIEDHANQECDIS